jgi:hypothetical protein
MREEVRAVVNRLAKASLLVLLASALAVNVAAQGNGPETATTEGPPSPRLREREAPTREPEILEQIITPEGPVNTVIKLPAEADAYIASEWSQQNFGTDALYLGYNLVGDPSFGAERMLLRFDVTGNIPRGAVVNDAQLRLHLSYSSPSDDAPMPTHLRQTLSAWEELTVTWNLEPTWGPVRAENEVGSAITWYEWDVTELVEEWVARTAEEHGVEILCDERVQQRERAFYSRETTNSLYPRLMVDYTDFNDTEAPTVTVDSLPTFVGRDFTVSWSGKDPGGSGIASYDVQYRVDGGDWVDWLVDVTFSSAVFAAGQDGKFYEFRARGEDRAGNVEQFGPSEASTTVDADPPATVVDSLPTITRTTTFTVSWTGEDEGSGIHYYDTRYRFNRGTWVLWQDHTLVTATTFTAMKDGVYDFEARAVDEVGNREMFTAEPEASIIVDAEPPFVEPKEWLPLIFRNG